MERIEKTSGIFKTKITDVNNLDRFNSRLEVSEKSISERENRSIKIVQSEDKGDWRKNRAWGSYGIISHGLTGVIGDPEG